MIESIELKNNVTSRTLSLNMLRDTKDFLLSSVTWGNVVSSKQTFKLTSGIGESISYSSLGIRNIEILGWVLGTSEDEMSRRKAFLNQFINPSQKITLFYKSYKIDFYPDNSISYALEEKENNDLFCKFKVEGTAFYPLFSEVDTQKIDVANITPKFNFPLIMSKEPNPPGGIIFGEKSKNLIVPIYNTGDVETGMEIILDATRGTVKNPKLINVNTGEFFGINKELNNREIVSINTNQTLRKVVGRGQNSPAEENYFKYRDLRSTWLQLQAGNNLFTYDAEEGLDNLAVRIYFTGKFLEVERCF